MLIYISRFVIFVMMTIWVSTASASEENKSVVRVGIYENRPKIFLDENGDASGFWPELLDEIAKNENWSIEYIFGSWTEGLERLVAGEIDVLPDVAFTEKRAAKFTFSDDSVLMSWTRLYIRNNFGEFQSIHDLNGRKVAALRNSVNLEGPNGLREMIQNFNLDIELVELDDYQGVFQAVHDGEVDAGISNRDFGNKNLDKFDLRNTPIIFQPINIKFAFPPESDSQSEIRVAVNTNMKEFLKNENSIYYRLLTEYFESEIAEKKVEVLPGYVSKVLFFTGGLFLFLGSILLVSRIQVRRQTYRIREQNKALLVSEQKYSEILNSPSDVIFIHDAETGLVLEVNDAIIDMYGFQPEEVPKLDFSSISDETSSFAFKSAKAMMKKTIIEGPQVFEWKARKKSGETFWVEVALKYSRILGKGRIIAVVRDIDERKCLNDELAAEQEMLSVTLRSIADAVITTDLKGNVILLNKVAEELTEWRQEDARGKNLSEVFSIVDAKTGDISESPFKKVMASGRIEGLNENTILISRTGKRLAVADSGAPICNRNSEVMGMVLVFRDITNQIRMEEEILKVKKLESIGILAGGIAHDFNNILAAILGNINLIATIEGASSDTFPLVEEAEKAILRATKLTKQLLTFAKGGDPVLEAASVSKIIEESAEFILRGSSVACSYDFEENLWLVNADSGQISQVIQNLVLNAREAMPEGGTIKISCTNCSQCTLLQMMDSRNDKFVKITIEDSGIGMPGSVLEKIFDPFFTTKKQGSGLGLAITYSIIQKHSGSIFVDSTPGEGTQFTMYLPIAETPEADPDLEQSRNLLRGSAKILVMDDEKSLRKVFQSMIKHLGHEVLLVEDGESAIQVFREHQNSRCPFDLVLLDLTVPGGMGGVDAGREILAEWPKTKIAVTSGYSIDPVIANFSDYGFSGALAKPIELTELKHLIDSLLG